MELKKSDAAVCPEPMDAQTGSTSAVEIDLYDELITFAELSPEEQSRVADLPNKALEQPEEDSSAQADEHELSEPALTQAPVKLDFAIHQVETPAEKISEEDAALSVNRPQVSVEPVKPELATMESSLPPTEAAQIPFEPVLTDAQIEIGESEHVLETSTTFTGEDEESAAPEPVPTPAAMEVVEAVTIVPVAEPVGESEVLKPSAETSGNRISPVAGPRPSGPLSGFNLPPEIVYKGTLSRGVCLACGAEAGADDLFCLTCGVFIDEAASTLPSNPTCTECKQRIDADEIFCPWCGSSVTE
jgi:hypothetical protein